MCAGDPERRCRPVRRQHTEGQVPRRVDEPGQARQPGDEHAQRAHHRDVLDLVARHGDYHEQRHHRRQSGDQPDRYQRTGQPRLQNSAERLRRDHIDRGDHHDRACAIRGERRHGSTSPQQAAEQLTLVLSSHGMPRMPESRLPTATVRHKPADPDARFLRLPDGRWRPRIWSRGLLAHRAGVALNMRITTRTHFLRTHWRRHGHTDRASQA